MYKEQPNDVIGTIQAAIESGISEQEEKTVFWKRSNRSSAPKTGLRFSNGPPSFWV